MSAPADRILALSLGRQSRILSISPDGSEVTSIVSGLTALPDGLTIDLARRRMYYTFMGTVYDGEDFWETDGYVESANLDGSDRQVIVPIGKIVTGKQIVFDPEGDRLYWTDREGMRVLSARTDGSDLVVHVQTGAGEDREDRRRHPVGVAVDRRGGFLYWSQKGKPNGNEGLLLRAPLDLRPADPAARTDIEVLLDGLPEPIDLEWDGEASMLYWTDRGDPPNGNTLNRARVGANGLSDHEILFKGLQEGIGLAHDTAGRRMFISDLAGHLYEVRTDPPFESRLIIKNRASLVGIAYLPG
ncbi:MAG: hypothetical protein QM674_11315 [Burkholderiaceae bacterium]